MADAHGPSSRARAMPPGLGVPGCLALAGVLTLGAACHPTTPGVASSGKSDTATQGSDATETTPPETEYPLICVPDQVMCLNDTSLGRCAPTGKEWIAEPCGTYQRCDTCLDGPSCEGPRCIGICESEEELPSSAGCSFLASRMLHPVPSELEDFPDALIIGNPSAKDRATAQLYMVREGRRKEEPLGEPVVLAPGETHIFELTSTFLIGRSSMFGTGGIYRVESDLPIVAYQHSPLDNSAGNDASMLLPEKALGREYVIASYSPQTGVVPSGPYKGEPLSGEPSYFHVIAIEDGTVVTWSPPVDTAGNGLPIKSVRAGETGSQRMNRFDSMRIAASANFEMDGTKRDVSGTLVTATQPVWVIGGSYCSNVPVDVFWCDPLQELMLPLTTWGKTYVGAHSPVRGMERHHWRIFAGEDNVTVTTDPPQPGTPFTLAKRGDFENLVVTNGTSFVFRGDGAFLPVQYLEGKLGSGIGDPSMYQMVPVEQFMKRYSFVTGMDYDIDYVQVIRAQGDADVFVDGTRVTGYQAVAEFEVADWVIAEGSHLAQSESPFGIVQLGYTKGDASYAYPGGMKIEAIFAP